MSGCDIPTVTALNRATSPSSGRNTPFFPFRSTIALAGTVKVLHTLRPFAVAMAGDDTFDPWKD